MAALVLKEAQSYLGVTKGSSYHRALVDRYNSVSPKPVGYIAKYSDDWCDIFVTVVGDQTGLSHLIGRECGVQRHIHWFTSKGIWLGRARPKLGDIITFDWDGGGFADHIGFVEQVNGDLVVTIEGNSSNQVARRTYLWNDWRIKGYARPKYEKQTVSPKKSIDALAKEVLKGKWGTGASRVARLTASGYNAQAVQKRVNELVKQKSVNEVAKEVLAGKWGNGGERVNRLTKAGYSVAEVQKMVNDLVRNKK